MLTSSETSTNSPIRSTPRSTSCDSKIDQAAAEVKNEVVKWIVSVGILQTALIAGLVLKLAHQAMLERGAILAFVSDMKSPTPATSPFRIVIVHSVVSDAKRDDASIAAQAQRAAALQAGLLDSGYEIVASVQADVFLPDRIAQFQPDLIIIDAESDARAVLEHVVSATGDARRPIVLFTDDDSPASMDAAMAAGVAAYSVAGLRAERVKPVLNVALARFRQEQKLLDELSDTRQKLAERKIIERAKGVLMARQNLSEDEAFQKLRALAMNKKLKLADVAQRILDADDLLA